METKRTISKRFSCFHLRGRREMSSIIFAVFLALFTLVFSAKTSNILTLPVEGKIAIPDGTQASNFQLSLRGDDAEYVAMTAADGSFQFHEIPSGIYLLDVLSIHQAFPQMKLKVSAENGTVHAVEYKYPGAKRLPANYPLVLNAIVPITYFQTRPPFSIFDIFGNPMMLMMMVSVGVIIFFPKMLNSIDPEKLKQEMGDDGNEEVMKMMKSWGLGGGSANDDI